MTMGPITDWTSAKAHQFGKANLAFAHDLHTRPMFDDAGLEQLLDQYPRERLGVFTMGEDPVDWQSWRRGSAGALSGSRLLNAAHEGRIWLNLRATNHYLPQYEALSDEIFADKQANVRGLKTFKRDLGMLISSADAQVFFHLDTPLVSLWQLRGQKRVWVYPPEAPFVPAERLEGVVLRETAEQMPFDPAWDARAEVHDLIPGRMVTWRQNAPHRIVNGPMLNVSLSIEFMTPAALLRANVLYANGVLRRRAGLRPRIQCGAHPAALAKVAFARAWKATGLQRTHERTLPTTFDLARELPGAKPHAA
jgi:hypothetical protein